MCYYLPVTITTNNGTKYAAQTKYQLRQLKEGRCRTGCGGRLTKYAELCNRCMKRFKAYQRIRYRRRKAALKKQARKAAK
jgi:hypothetical protein